MQFSAEQQAAIAAKNPELLVSAAAGSGKTAVLIEKIYTMLRDEGMAVDRMLVVTFTNAAAAEMRERLKQRIAGDPLPHLRRARERLDLAHISTLHIFCHKIVQEFFQVVDIDPLSAIADAATAAALLQEATDEAMEALYARAQGGDPAAKALTDKFEDKQIVQMAGELYTFLMTLPDPYGWLRAQAETVYTMDTLETGAIADTLLADCRVLLDGARELAEELLLLSEHPVCPEKYIPVMRADHAAVADVLQAADAGLLPVVRAAQRFTLDRMPALRNLPDEEKEINERYKELRKGMKDLVGKVAGQLDREPEQLLARLNAMQPALGGLAALSAEQHRLYMEKKKQRCVLDFSDLEHMALSILSHPEIRAMVAGRFDAVFVDEYQDISGVQEALLSALKRPADVSRETSAAQTNREILNNTGEPEEDAAHTALPQRYFYVGDVKQSIYRFRQADPTLFMDKEKAFGDGEAAPQRRIDLNRNYRSRGAVLEAVNRVFSQIMRPDVTEIHYDSRARLYPGQTTQEDPPVQLHVFTAHLTSAEKVRVQAAAIAEMIGARVGQPFFDRKENRMRTLRCRDIAVLAPRMKGVDEVVTRALAARRIPAYAEGGGAGLQSDEIAQVLCHLRLLDNIQDDVSLLTCLRSPAVDMTDEELARVRIRTPNGSYLEAVRAAAQGEDALSSRCAGALDALAHERFLMRNMSLPDYLWNWLSRSGLYAFYGCQPFGRLRQANLRLLCEKAVEFQSRGGGGLHAFLQSVVSPDSVRESQSPTVLSPKEDVVRVMSVHKSKGLEFPVVFLMGLEEGFAQRRSSLLSLHARLGAALPYIDEVRRVKGDTLLSSAIALRQQTETLAERARVLYVGMTRARDELLLLGCTEVPQLRHARPSAYTVGNAKHMLDWLVACADPERDELLSTDPADRTQSTSFPHKTGVFRIVSHNSAAETVAFLQSARPQVDAAAVEKQREKLARLTEDARMLAAGLPPAPDAADPLAPPMPDARRPYKVGVTALVRARRGEGAQAPLLVDAEDGDPGDMETVQLKRLPLPLTRPRQMADLPALPAFMREAGAGPKGVQRGVAMHKSLCLLHYPALRAAADADALRLSIHEQLQRFLQKRQLTEEEFALVDAGALAAFFASPWGRRALEAETVHREWGFVLSLPEEDGLLVQGVIDLCYLSDGQWELIDYKTDAVDSAQALFPLYGEQVALYRRALETITGLPVRSVTLYALSLGAGATQTAPFPA